MDCFASLAMTVLSKHGYLAASGYCETV
jgi:hypothetical protein